RADWEQPCLRAFWETVCLPWGVRGPVDFLEFWRLAASFLAEIGRAVGDWDSKSMRDMRASPKNGARSAPYEYRWAVPTPHRMDVPPLWLLRWRGRGCSIKMEKMLGSP